MRPAAASLLLLFAAGCAAGGVATTPPNVDPAPVRPPVVAPPPPPPLREPSMAPAEANGRGLMPLASTNAWAFRQANGTWDGRGVLIAILDSGIDPTVPGLSVTSTGDPKTLDLRDFSGEGRIALATIQPSGDGFEVGGRTLRGASRVAALNPTGPYYGGVLRERVLGELPANDLDGDGLGTDVFALVVTRASDGWVLFADTNGDGSLADERPVHDYLLLRETFGWHIPGRPSPLGIAANFSETDGAPTLDLLFDTSGHGTHVAGIAAGAGLYGVKGFDGVAPGAQLIGLKIANNAYGGISVTGSMMRAMDYAIRFASERGFPLVMNLSFGVGNEREGNARIDALVDSVLAEHPDVLLVTSAGNDGPGLSTMGFPASAGRPLTVGATLPAVFLGLAAGEVVAFFSSRGGELAKPDIMAPGIAYSSVPRWSTGEEIKNGTSMASPHVAGAVALLLGAARLESRSLVASQIKQAIVATARPLANALAPDQGPGLLDVTRANDLLRRLPAVAVMNARVGPLAAGGAWDVVGSGSADSTVVVTLEGGLPGPIRIRSDQPWLSVPSTVQNQPPVTTFRATIRSAGAAGAGVHAATITGWASDTTIGPLFRTTAMVVRPVVVPDSSIVLRSRLPAAANYRVFIPADSGRPFRVAVGLAGGPRTSSVLAFLHEPGGQPNRTGTGLEGHADAPAEYEIDGRDVVAGNYELVASAPPAQAVETEVRIQRSPVSFGATRSRPELITGLVTNRTGGRVKGTALFGFQGAERRVVFSQRGGAERRVGFRVPAWANRIVVELTLPRDQWPLFTDLGLTLVDSTGQVLQADPLNYAVGRLAMDLDPDSHGDALEVVISPGLAGVGAMPLWNGELSIRFYAAAPVLMETAETLEFDLAPGATSQLMLPLAETPWSLDPTFFPLGSMVVDVGGVLWGRELPLSDPVPAVQR
ncbi:MAG: S8 family serine peptidase [Gemmatimonadales bacterium]